MNQSLVRMAQTAMARDRLKAGGDDPLDRLTSLAADNELVWDATGAGFLFMARAGQKLAVRSLCPAQII
jgi:hypothetical protein